MTRPSRNALLGALLLGLSTAACAPLVRPVIDHRGYVPDPEALASVRTGVDNKMSIESRLGTPSTAANFNGETWYYISAEQKSYMFRRPQITKQEVVAIRFDQSELVSEIAHYGLEDGRIVNFVNRQTPTKGKELTFLEQMFGNFGRFNAQTENEGTPRRGN